MIMYEDFLFDVKVHIRNMPEQVFSDAGLSQEAILGNEKKLNTLWGLYQKSIVDYGCDPKYSYGDALKTVYNIDYIPIPDS